MFISVAKKIVKFFTRKKENENSLPEKMPEKLVQMFEGVEEEKLIKVKSDYTDDFMFEEVWLAFYDNVLYKCQKDEVTQFELASSDELFVDVTPTSLALVLKQNDIFTVISSFSRLTTRLFICISGFSIIVFAILSSISVRITFLISLAPNF